MAHPINFYFGASIECALINDLKKFNVDSSKYLVELVTMGFATSHFEEFDIMDPESMRSAYRTSHFEKFDVMDLKRMRSSYPGEIDDVIACRKRLLSLRSKKLNELFSTADELLTIINNHLPRNFDNVSQAAPYIRPLFAEIFSWSIPSQPALTELLKFIAKDSVLEVGGGRGLWAALLQISGVDIICTSLSTTQVGKLDFPEDWTWMKVELIDADMAISKYKERSCLFISWGEGAMSCLNKFTGNKLIVIGEGEKGCTDYLDDGKYDFKLYGKIKIPQWRWMNDIMRLYRRQTKS